MFPIEFLRRSALASPNKVAATDGSNSCTYGELLARAEALGAALQAVAGKSRPVIAILGPNSVEMLVTLMAVHASGAVLVPLNARNAKPELDAQIRRVRPDVMIVQREYLDKLTSNSLPLLIAGADPSEPRSIAAIEGQYAGERPVWHADLSDINAIKFTGGSSGVPKGVMQSFRCINTVVCSIIMTFEIEPSDRYLCVAPMTHGAGTFLLPILARGGCIVMMSDVKPAKVLEAIERERITITWMPPTMLYRLIDEQKVRPRDMSSLAHLIWGGAAAVPTRLLEAQQVIGPVIECIFGQTEAPMMLSAARARDVASHNRIGSVGRIGPLVEVAIFDPDGNRLGANDEGEVWARGDLLMSGYFEMPEETARTIHDGWLRTGDVGYMDDEGFLFLKDRLRDVVISGGFNIYPSDVESIIAQHPAISEVVVYGVPDDDWGERVEATIELREGHCLEVGSLIAYCKERIGSVKSPKRVHIVNSLPRSPVGKVLRRDARENALVINTAEGLSSAANEVKQKAS